MGGVGEVIETLREAKEYLAKSIVSRDSRDGGDHSGDSKRQYWARARTSLWHSCVQESRGVDISKFDLSHFYSVEKIKKR